MQSCFIAGASRGIGLELARQIAHQEDFTHVFAGVRNPTSLHNDIAENSKIVPVQLDVTSTSQVTKATETIEKATGGSLDILIINAGIMITEFAVSASVEELQTTLETNTVAVHRIVRACLPLMRKGSAKKIVVMGASIGTFSVADHMAHMGFPAVGMYAVSKAATHMLTMLYGAELAREDFKTVSIHPGVVKTDMFTSMIQNHPEMAEGIKKSGLKLIDPLESVEGIVKVVKNLTAADSGKLISWEGEVVPF